MSFGSSAGDAILLVQLAWKTLLGARQACGEHDELTREIASLHKVLLSLQQEYENPESLLIRADDDRRQELVELCGGCEHVLKITDSIVSKYNALPEEKRSTKKLWPKVRFGNGEIQDLTEIRLKLSAHTPAIWLSLNLCSLSPPGRIENRLNNVGGELEGVRWKVDWIVANMAGSPGEGTVWSSYTDDDRGFWRELRRGLVKEGYRGSVVHRHKHLIKQYVEELGNSGVFGEDYSRHDKDDIGEEKGSLHFGSSDFNNMAETSQHAVDSDDQLLSPKNDLDGQLPYGNEGQRALDVINSRHNGDSKRIGSDTTSEAQVVFPEATRVVDGPMTPPDSPKTSKYLRFDKRIHVGSINPRAMKARTPEQQATHDKRKDERRNRTPQQRAAHEERKAERKSVIKKHRRVRVHAAHKSSSEYDISPSSGSKKRVQMEEMLDEECSQNTAQNYQEERKYRRESPITPGHTPTNSQSSTSGSSITDTPQNPKDGTPISGHKLRLPLRMATRNTLNDY